MRPEKNVFHQSSAVLIAVSSFVHVNSSEMRQAGKPDLQRRPVRRWLLRRDNHLWADPPMPSDSACGLRASMTSWICSSSGTPSRSAP